MQSLVVYLQGRFNNKQFCNYTDAIVNTLMLKFYKKLAQKTIIIEPREYTITVDVETAMAFIEYFSKLKINTISHAGNTIAHMMAEYDSHTTKFILTTNN